MIYEYPPAEAPIRQGDIFSAVPRIEIALTRIDLLQTGQVETVAATWDEVAHAAHPVTAVIPVKPVPAIVISQDCDITNGPDVSLSEIVAFASVEPNIANLQIPKKTANFVVQQAKKNQKWFYLPADPRIGFAERMAVDFRRTIRLAASDLGRHVHLRIGRLNPEADEHFRERLAEFYRRYPVDEWYPLSREEFESYRAEHAEANPQPRPWQT